MTRINWDTEPKKRQLSTKELHRKLEIVPIAMKLNAWGGPRKWQSRFNHQQVLAAILGQTRLDKFPCMTEDGKCSPCATPWAKQFQDDINSLKEFERREEGDDYDRELTGDLRKKQAVR